MAYKLMVLKFRSRAVPPQNFKTSMKWVIALLLLGAFTPHFSGNAAKAQPRGTRSEQKVYGRADETKGDEMTMRGIPLQPVPKSTGSTPTPTSSETQLAAPRRATRKYSETSNANRPTTSKQTERRRLQAQNRSSAKKTFSM